MLSGKREKKAVALRFFENSFCFETSKPKRTTNNIPTTDNNFTV